MIERYTWTNKLEGMFKDIGVSRDLVVAFREKSKADQVDAFKLSCSFSPFFPPIFSHLFSKLRIIFPFSKLSLSFYEIVYGFEADNAILTDLGAGC